MEAKYGKENMESKEKTEELLARLRDAALMVEVSDIDNENSMVYKVMYAFTKEGVNSPMKYILAFPAPGKTYNTPKEILENSSWMTMELYIKYLLENDSTLTIQDISDDIGIPINDILPVYYKYQRMLGKSDTDILESVNKYLEKAIAREDLMKNLEYYEYTVKATFDEDMTKYRTIIKLQEELIKFLPAKTTDIIFEDSRIKVDVTGTMNDKKIDETYGLEILDKSKVDSDVRYIQYNEGGQIIFDTKYINNPENKRGIHNITKKNRFFAYLL